MKLAAIFLIFFAVCGANAAVRPSWYQGVDVKFRAATPFYFEIWHASYNRPNLAHVVSWSDIEAIVDAWDRARRGPRSKRWDLGPFVNYLTEVDNQACVYNPSLNLPGCTLHTTILDHNVGVLRNLNTDIRNDVLAEIARIRPNISTIKRLLSSAPANLRYGTGQFNRKIQGWADPMGNNIKSLTNKEKSMIYATDPNCSHYQVQFLISHAFQAYYTYFLNVIVVNVNANSIHLCGTHYDPDPTIRTAANHQFVPISAANNDKLYVLSSSQAGACPLGTLYGFPLYGDQNTQGDTIEYYVKNV